MRSVVLYSLLSLDGEAESPDRYVLDWDDAMDANLAAVVAEQDAVLLGRQMYDEWSLHWPPSDMAPFAPFINGVAKYVFTSTPLTRPWTRTTVVHEPAESYVAGLKATDGGSIGVHGSLTLAQSLLRAGLVDELRLVTAPVTTGTGRRLFDGLDRQRWALAEVTGTPSGALLQHYRRRPV
jgi:dihydrofolate reductase